MARLGELLLTVACATTGCATRSTEITERSEIYGAIPPNPVAKIAVFANWYDSCPDRACRSNRQEAQAEITGCLSAGMQPSGSAVQVFNPAYMLQADSSALVNDPRTSGAPDFRFTADLRERLTRAGARYALLVDLTTSKGELKSNPDSVGGEYGAAFYTNNRQAVYTRFLGTLVDVSNGKWVARIERNFAGSAASGGGVAFLGPLPLPFVYSVVSTTERSACESMGRTIASIMRDGVIPGASQGSETGSRDAVDKDAGRPRIEPRRLPSVEERYGFRPADKDVPKRQ